MANLNLKKDFAKGDINFFAEFTANAQRMARILGYAIIAVVILAACIICYVAYLIIGNLVIQANIDSMNKKLQSEDYINLDSEATSLQQMLQDRNTYYFTLTSLKSDADSAYVCDITAIRTLEQSIPSDTTISLYTMENGMFTIEGLSFSYYSPTEMVNILQQSELFNDLDITIERNDPSEDATPDSYVLNTIPVYYRFTITGNLIGDYTVSCTSYVDADICGGVSTHAVVSGDSDVIDVPAQIEYNGVVNDLTSVLVDGVAVTADELTQIIDSQTMTITPTGNMEIVFNYTAPAATTEESEA